MNDRPIGKIATLDPKQLQALLTETMSAGVVDPRRGNPIHCRVKQLSDLR